MKDQIQPADINGADRLFNTALMASLVLHAAILGWVQTSSTLGSEESATPALSSIQVELAPLRAVPVREARQQASRPREVSRPPVREALAPAAPTAQEQQTPVADSAAPADDFDENAVSDAKESAAQSSSAVAAGVRDRYLASVLAHIESHKFYPQAARRRGLQGNVEVCFTLDALGMITDLHVSGGNSLFVEAAKTAVRNAIPLPAAPSSDGFPLSVRYQMIFKLQ